MRLRAPVRPALTALATTVAAGLALTACSTTGDSAGEPSPTTSGSASDSASSAPAVKEVVLVTHESFNHGKKLTKAFEQQTGYTLTVQATGDAGTLTNRLSLTPGDPTGDVAFGVDNTFASRALDEGVFAEYHPDDLPAGAEDYYLPGDDGEHLTPIDNGDVCVNIDKTWFAENGVPEPKTLEDLTEPAYKDLFVTPGATTSSPGLAFLLATIAEYGEDGWQDYWTRLLDNGAKVVDGWEDAYFTDFTQGGGKGQRPIVLSYDSSPAFTIGKNGESTTAALLDTCFQQVEYAGVLDGAKNVPGAEALIDFLLSDQVQAQLPELMYVFPVSSGVQLPADWAAHATRPTEPLTVDPDDIEANRESWLRDWSDLTTR